jgi:UDP-N-acetylmuramate dehydrogenase
MRISLPNFFLENQSLQDKTYYKMGGSARYFVQPQNILQVQESLFWCKKNNLPCSVLGSGSNSVYADGEFKGVVISLEKLAKWYWETDEYLFVEGGVTNTEISEICMAANRGGASWMYRMPGQMGASIRMNARCYGGEVSQIVRQVLTIDTEGILKTYTGEEVFKGYKSTLLMNIPEIVVGARLFFPQVVSSDKLVKHMHECEADRHKKKHFYLPSCGSTFKNNYVVGRPSGQVFDELGLKGTKVGNAEVSEYHANFIWNTGNASTNDMLTLTSIMRSKAKEQANADLELEVQPVGAFSQKLYDDCGMQYLGPFYQDNDGKKWVGLLYYPNTNQLVSEILNRQITFPHKIFESPFFEYSQIPFKGSPSTGAQIIQIIPLAEAKKSPKEPFIEWITYSTEIPDKIFPIAVKPEELFNDEKFINELWHYSVSELFIADSVNPAKNYFEFEMTPHGEWVAVEFKGIRKRSARNEKLIQNIWNGLKINNLCASFHNNKEMRYVFGMSFSYIQLEKLFTENEDSLFIQCALSLGYSRYYLAPYWKHNEFIQEKKGGLVAEKKVAANFHQPEKFWKIRLF